MRGFTRLWPLAALALVLGCDVPDKLPKVDWPLPKSKDGLWELIQVAGSRVAIDPTQKDPITAVARCADLVTGCYETGATTLDACIAEARSCTTKEPWNEDEDCCPSACARSFEAERKKGAAPLVAFERVFFEAPECFPGVLEALEGDR